jgi:hypothetical protein
MSYIIPEKDLIFYKDKEGGIYSGGFSVNSIMLREGLSPIITINHESGDYSNDTQELQNNKVSDFFNDLVIPNWALAYTINDVVGEKNNNYDEDDDIISDDLYNQLLGLVMVDEKTLKGGKKKTRRNKLKISGKKTRKQK